MQSYTVLVLVALVVAVTSQENYPGKWNHVDTHQIIDNERLLKKYEECILGSSTTGCPQEAIELKRVLNEVLREVCAKCTQVQVEKVRDTLSYMCLKRPQTFARIVAKVDPEGKFRPAFEAKFGKINGNC